MKKLIILITLLICMVGLSAAEYTLPRVLFLTTGDGEGRGTVSDGVVLAIQQFNKLGAVVRLENREVLYKPEIMDEYQIMVLPTTYGYHDGDRKFSLSYLSQNEMENLVNWVQQGGMIISDTYLGRNKINGEDRITKEGFLNSSNWMLAECFGVELRELNMQNDSVKPVEDNIWQDEITGVFGKEEWVPVIQSTRDNARILAEWDVSGKPAAIASGFGKGKTILLQSFNMLHPAADGGYSNVKEIESFYSFAFAEAVAGRKHDVQLNPWPNSASAALCFTFDDGGSVPQYKRVLSWLKKSDIPSEIFVTEGLNPEISELLKKQKNLKIQNRSANHPDFRKLDWHNTLQEIQSNMNNWEKLGVERFDGFRFPFTNNSYLGLKALAKMNYRYDSSIGLNHLEFYRGALFPYNIPIFRDGITQSLDLLELSQNFHDDWFYYRKSLDAKVYDAAAQKKDSSLYNAYLNRLWERAVLPGNGLMVVLGHPMYSGISELTMEPIKHLAEAAEEAGAWITTPSDICDYWLKKEKLEILVQEEGETAILEFTGDYDDTIPGLTFKLKVKPKKVEFKGKTKLSAADEFWLLELAEVSSGDKLEITF